MDKVNDPWNSFLESFEEPVKNNEWVAFSETSENTSSQNTQDNFVFCKEGDKDTATNLFLNISNTTIELNPNSSSNKCNWSAFENNNSLFEDSESSKLQMQDRKNEQTSSENILLSPNQAAFPNSFYSSSMPPPIPPRRCEAGSCNLLIEAEDEEFAEHSDLTSLCFQSSAENYKNVKGMLCVFSLVTHENYYNFFFWF